MLIRCIKAGPGAISTEQALCGADPKDTLNACQLYDMCQGQAQQVQAMAAYAQATQMQAVQAHTQAAAWGSAAACNPCGGLSMGMDLTSYLI